ncbi:MULTISPECIES: hypothetical protein [unclassified Cupriavidus]|uniref:hypothetical protein n=1 Tax=unclassified Cupriavidus TaxID=2640874 RepID=UPI00313E0A92
MGQAKSKQQDAFARNLIEEWESRDCVDFAVALARRTGWLLHVDWWSTSSQRPSDDCEETNFRPLRVYVADNADLIFDPRGVMSIFDFAERIVRRQARDRGFNNGGVLTRFYAEERFAELPLRYQPDEKGVTKALAEIERHPTFLARIPSRNLSGIAAHHAARFSFGLCAIFAEAMRDHAGLQPTALLAKRFLPGWQGTQVSERGYFHSIVLDSDGAGQDAWGKASLSDIALRYGVAEFETSEEEHRRVVQRLKQNTPDLFAKRYSEAISLIRGSD